MDYMKLFVLYFDNFYSKEMNFLKKLACKSFRWYARKTRNRASITFYNSE